MHNRFRQGKCFDEVIFLLFMPTDMGISVLLTNRADQLIGLIEDYRR